MMKSMAVKNEDIKMRKIISLIMIVALSLSIGILFFISAVQFFDGPIAYVPVGKTQPVAIQVVNKDKTDYEILVPGDKGYDEALEKASHIAVSPDYVPSAKKKLNLKY